MSEESKIAMEDFLKQLEEKLKERYFHYRDKTQSKTCEVMNCSIASLKFRAFYFDTALLKGAIDQIKKDIEIIYLRRNMDITKEQISEGLIAGVITYRLLKPHIINISSHCVYCSKGKCLSHLDINIAIKIGLDYIHRKYPNLHEGIRKELVYTIKHRHLNQETLGLVFDTMLEYIPNK